MKMRIIIVCVLTLTTALGLAACSSGDRGSGGGKPDVVVAFYPLQWIVEEAAPDGTTVENLTPAGAEPHELELGPKDVAKLRSAEVVLYVGGGFQPAVEDALKGSDVRAIDVLETPGLELLDHDEAHEEGEEEEREGEEEHAEDGDDHGHEHEGSDPHVWLDPVRFATIAEHVADELGWDADDVTKLLGDLDGKFEAGLADCEREDVFTSHEAFGYLTDRYGLHQVAVSGVSPEAEPKPKDLERVADEAERAGATTIFFESLVSPKLSEQVAEEIGAKTAVLDPIEGIADDRLDDGADYRSVMDENLSALRAALGCPGAQAADG